MLTTPNSKLALTTDEAMRVLTGIRGQALSFSLLHSAMPDGADLVQQSDGTVCNVLEFAISAVFRWTESCALIITLNNNTQTGENSLVIHRKTFRGKTVRVTVKRIGSFKNVGTLGQLIDILARYELRLELDDKFISKLTDKIINEL